MRSAWPSELRVLPKVLNIHKDGKPRGSIYIGRSSKWGNRYIIGKDGTRAEVIEKYRQDVMKDNEFRKQIKEELAGKDLVCHCKPKACHGDVLLEIANLTTLFDLE